MNDFEIVLDKVEDLIKVFNKTTGDFVKNHTQDIIKGRITERIDRGDIVDDDGRVWYDNNNIAYDNYKVGMRLISFDNECRAIVAYGLLTDNSDANIETDKILDNAPFVTVFNTNRKQLLNLKRRVLTTDDSYFDDRDTLAEEDFNIRFSPDSIKYSNVSDNHLTHNRYECMGILDYNGRKLFKKEKNEIKKPAKQRADELMSELEAPEK